MAKPQGGKTKSLIACLFAVVLAFATAPGVRADSGTIAGSVAVECTILIPASHMTEYPNCNGVAYGNIAFGAGETAQFDGLNGNFSIYNAWGNIAGGGVSGDFSVCGGYDVIWQRYRTCLKGSFDWRSVQGSGPVAGPSSGWVSNNTVTVVRSDYSTVMCASGLTPQVSGFLAGVPMTLPAEGMPYSMQLSGILHVTC